MARVVNQNPIESRRRLSFMKLKAIITSLFFIGALSAGTALADDKIRGFDKADKDDQIHGFHKADKLKDQSVNSIDGEKLGTIENLLISDNGDVFIVLSKDNGEMVPVPWQAANLMKGEDDKLTSSITQQQLEEAPSFEDLADITEHEQEARGYFGTDTEHEPYGIERDGESPMLQDSPQVEQSPGTVN
jgi:hypothetical protein